MKTPDKLRGVNALLELPLQAVLLPKETAMQIIQPHAIEVVRTNSQRCLDSVTRFPDSTVEK